MHETRRSPPRPRASARRANAHSPGRTHTSARWSPAPHHQIKDRAARTPASSQFDTIQWPSIPDDIALMDIRNAELPDEATVDSDAQKSGDPPRGGRDQRDAHVLGEKVGVCSSVSGGQVASQAQPVPVSTAPSIKVAVLLAAHRADDPAPADGPPAEMGRKNPRPQDPSRAA